ncbi:reverse transcriptase domain-containing protein [Tanacetum coccineum]
MISSRLAIMDPPGDIMVPTTPLKKSLIPVSIGRLFIEMPMTWSHSVTLVNVKAKSHNLMRCLKTQFKFARSFEYGHRIYGSFPSSEGTSTYPRAVDYLSKWVEAKALPTNDARVVCKFLKSLFAHFGTPHAIISDRGKNRASWSDKLEDALWAFRTAFKTPIGCTPYKLVYEKACHLPIELEYKAYWALKH